MDMLGCMEFVGETFSGMFFRDAPDQVISPEAFTVGAIVPIQTRDGEVLGHAEITGVEKVSDGLCLTLRMTDSPPSATPP